MSNAILKAAHQLGGQASLARAMGVQPPTVNQWVKGDRPIPAERCPQIEALTSGNVRCEELRPDVDWAVLRKPSRKAKPTQAA